jgi:hypothetical protein
MKRFISFLATGTLLAISATSTHAGQIQRSTGDLVAGSTTFGLPGQSSRGCTELKAGEVIWVTVSEDDETEKVESYPSGTSRITAQFEYNCIPRRTTIVTVWSYEGAVISTAEHKPEADNKPGSFSAHLFTQDDSPLLDGEYGVAFYVNKKLIAEGKVIVGDDDPVEEAITVQGTVVDSRSGRPIRGAFVVVLKEGVSVDEWLDSGSVDDVLAVDKTNSKGEFVLSNPIPVGVPHDFAVGAEGYRLLIEKGWVIEEDEAEDPLVLEIKLVRIGR